MADHAFAVEGVVGQCVEFLNSRTLMQRRFLPSEAPPKFAASRYYALLRERVGEPVGGESGPGDDIVRAVVPRQAQTPGASPKAGPSGIDLILSGQAFCRRTLSCAQPPTIKPGVFQSSHFRAGAF